MVDRRVERAEKIAFLCREFITAEARVYKTSEARRALPAGSSRAKVTTANARWSSACEFRDVVAARLVELGVSLEVAS